MALELGVSRSTVAQMELGNRPVTSLELDRLAYLCGRGVAEFFEPEFREEDALVAIFRRHPEVSDQKQIVEAVRQCMELGRELTGLERLLGLERDLGLLAEYPLRVPSSRWEAIEQGKQLAEEERRRLGLGIAPAPNLAELLEVRANVFAANFLMPAEGVRLFFRRLAKGTPSRLRAETFDNDDFIVAEARTEPGTQAIQLYDVVHLAHHFGVSRPAMIYRLQNLKLVTEQQAEELRTQNNANLGKKLTEFLGLDEPDGTKARNEFRHRFLNLALEAFRREEITKAKLVELATMVGVQRSELREILDRTGLESDDGPQGRDPDGG